MMMMNLKEEFDKLNETNKVIVFISLLIFLILITYLVSDLLLIIMFGVLGWLIGNSLARAESENE